VELSSKESAERGESRFGVGGEGREESSRASTELAADEG